MSHSTRLQELVSRGVCRPAASLPAPMGPADGAFGLDELAGAMTELSSGGPDTAALSIAIGLVAEAQAAGELAAWVHAAAGTFFPPDARDAGVDPGQLVVVRVPGSQAAGRAADKLLRSGAFGLVVLDLGDGNEASRGLTPALQGRLAGLAQKHATAVICLTDKPAAAPSLGPGVALRAEARRTRAGDAFAVELRALKDRRGRGRVRREVALGPPGLR